MTDLPPAPAPPSSPARLCAAPLASADPVAAAEAQLLARLKAGEEAAFDELVAAHGGRLLAVARRYLPSEADAMDAVQDAFLSAFRALATFEGSSRLNTWLHRITVNACLMKLRSRRRRPERSIDGLLPEFLPDGHHRNPTQQWKPPGSTGIEAAEERALVRSKINELPEHYRAVLMLRDIEGLDTEQAAAALGLTASGVKTRLHRARMALRTLLDPYFAEGALSEESA